MHVATELVLCECKNVLQREERVFIISDKLTVGHQATPGTQLPTDVVSLHVSHHNTIKGTVPPAKCGFLIVKAVLKILHKYMLHLFTT